jgi:hypothetical protein
MSYNKSIEIRRTEKRRTEDEFLCGGQHVQRESNLNHIRQSRYPRGSTRATTSY